MPKATADLIPITTLHNLPLGEIVDQLGRVKAEAAEIKARGDLLKAELTARGVNEAEGDLFRATVTVASRWTLDAEREGRDGRGLVRLALQDRQRNHRPRHRSHRRHQGRRLTDARGGGNITAPSSMRQNGSRGR